MAELPVPVPIVVVAALLAVRPADRAQFRLWADDLVHQDPTRPETITAAKEASAGIGAYFREGIEDRPRHAPLLAVCGCGCGAGSRSRWATSSASPSCSSPPAPRRPPTS